MTIGNINTPKGVFYLSLLKKPKTKVLIKDNIPASVRKLKAMINSKKK